jgi:hypothetical protein
MKKLVLSVALAAFAVAVQAGDGTCSSGGCCASKTTTETKAECPAAKQAKVTKAKSNKQLAAKQQVQSPKAMADARR